MYTEEQLASFANYLFKRYDVQEYSTDGKNIPLSLRQVSDADVCNWKTETDSNTWFPSLFGIGDQVLFAIHQTYGQNPYPFKAKILAVHFYEGKVKYDLEIPIETESPTRIYNIDSCFVLPLQVIPAV